MLIDTDVLIWLTRGHIGAATRLSSVVQWRVSAVSYMELLQGCRDKQEMVRIKKGFAAASAVVVPISEAICDRAVGLVETYALSHGLQMADALIAATAQVQDLTVLTANTKHFQVISALSVEAFLP